jgi:hypothetical protein
MFKFIKNESPRKLTGVEQMMGDFYPYAKKKLGFDQDATIILQSNPENAKNPLGKTAYYEPSEFKITVFVDGRHPKDIMRSASHELVHHSQNCRGEFTGPINSEDGYAQTDTHMREMEREAYETGNLMFRDWEDGIKSRFLESIREEIRKDRKILTENRLNKQNMTRIIEKKLKAQPLIKQIVEFPIKKASKSVN